MYISQLLVIVGFILLVVLVLILREFWAWYWKTNKLIQQQATIIDRLDTIIDQQAIQPTETDDTKRL